MKRYFIKLASYYAEKVQIKVGVARKGTSGRGKYPCMHAPATPDNPFAKSLNGLKTEQ